MGMVFQKKYRDKTSGERRTCETWTIRYYRNGKQFQEATKSTSRRQAESILKLREGDVERGLDVNPALYRVTFGDAVKAVIADYKDRGNRSLPDVERRIEQHLKPFFDGLRLSAITSTKAREYRQRREEAGMAPATINREMAVLKRAFKLMVREGRVASIPHLPMARERNARQGFFSDEQFADLVTHLSPEIAAVARFAFITGWRIPSEILRLKWSHVDFENNEVRLDPGTTKNDEGRTFPFTKALELLLGEQKAVHDALKVGGRICPYVFNRDGQQIRDFRGEWKVACVAAGVPGRIPHDFRRTAARNLVRAGVPEVIAMRLMGHKTRSIFDRYNVVNGSDLTQAVRLMNSRQTALDTAIAGGDSGLSSANASQDGAPVNGAERPVLRSA